MIPVSLLDTDFYKLTMQQIVFHRFRDAQVQYQFFCRQPDVDFSACVNDIQTGIQALCALRFSEAELRYLKDTGFFSEDYLTYLKTFQLSADAVSLTHNDGLQLTITGSWLDTILFETPLLALINEVYCQQHASADALEIGQDRLQAKCKLLTDSIPDGQLKFADFGTRRRFSFAWQTQALQLLQAEIPRYCIGTSNVYFAKQLGIKPIGTMAHEYIQAMQVLAPDLRGSQQFGFAQWFEEYGKPLSIALADTYNTQVFLKDFNQTFCECYQGVRHDSGDPTLFANRYIEHLKTFGIDPSSKTIVFSNGLTFDAMIALYEQFHQQVGLAFGIGTNLLNDMGSAPLNIVIKMTHCNGLPVAKISEDPEKTMLTDKTYLEKLKNTFDLL